MAEISIEIAELLYKARVENKWLWTHYQDIWFTPDELEAEQRAGRFRWGAVNWTLRDPMEYLEDSKRRLDAARADHERRILKVSGVKHDAVVQ